jgi:hypothetical protein
LCIALGAGFIASIIYFIALSTILTKVYSK